jgi:hypothetical protein
MSFLRSNHVQQTVLVVVAEVKPEWNHTPRGRPSAVFWPRIEVPEHSDVGCVRAISPTCPGGAGVSSSSRIAVSTLKRGGPPNRHGVLFAGPEGEASGAFTS